MASNFEYSYNKVREKEKRIYSDAELALLPEIPNEHIHYKEWEVRRESFNRLKKYLLKKKKSLHILDLGCGNGWMSNQLSQINHSTIIGIDAHAFEINQAKRVFSNNSRAEFIHSDFSVIPNEKPFDIIILASSIQYFKDLNVLFGQLKSILTDKGEIHIIDSPFYKPEGIERAKSATQSYYSKMDFPEMASFYHHHTWEELEPYDPQIKNRTIADKLLIRLFKTKGNYFPWIVIKNYSAPPMSFARNLWLSKGKELQA